MSRPRREPAAVTSVIADTEAGRNCPYCRFPLKAGAPGATCTSCRAVHHADCWFDNGGCAIVGCVNAPAHRSRPSATPPATTTERVSGRPPEIDRPSSGRPIPLVPLGLLGVAIAVLVVAVVIVIGARSGTTHKIVREVTVAGRASSSNSSGSTGASGPVDGTGSTGSSDSGVASDSTGSSGSQLTPFSGSGYAISYPSGWQNIHNEKPISDYVESSWSPPGDTNVTFLVDHNASSGSAETDASNVRDPVSAHTTDYQELEWDSQQLPPGTGWVWKFTSRGAEEFDTFFSACGTSYAVLGKAPIGEFSSYETVFAAARDSLKPNC